ncbi:MAG: insulinase family protein [Gemmatimonadetes bacterium]|nr:insulinase family protein [Gemmatimonadota bacterium]
MNAPAIVARRAAAALALGLVSAGVVRAQGPIPTAPPALGKLNALTLPPTTRSTLPNGLRLMVVRKADLPLVDFLLVIRSGAESDPADRGGVATLTADLLDEGTTTRTALDIADQQAYLGVQLGTSAGFDQSTVVLHTPRAQLDSALALFADVVLRPSFAPADFDRLKKDRMTQLLQVKDRGTVIADRVFPAVVYGPEHPYGRPTNGTEASTTSLTRDDVARFYATYYRPNNATLIVVGDVEPAAIAARIAALLGGWSRAAVPGMRRVRPEAAAPSTIHLVDKPGAAQSSLRAGALGAPRSTPDYFPLQVMNTILGGPFTSRLNRTLREEKGYTYGAVSRFEFRRDVGPWLARSEIMTAKTDSALLIVMAELGRIREPVPADELDKARQYLVKQMPEQFETTRDIAARLVPVALYGLPTDYYNRYAERVEAVTAADVQRVARRYIDPRTLQVVIVGDRSKIEAGLAATRVAPIVRRDLEARPVP